MWLINISIKWMTKDLKQKQIFFRYLVHDVDVLSLLMNKFILLN